MLSIFCAPSRYVQGRNATAVLGEELDKLGLKGPTFILASKSARQHLDPVWAETFQSVGMKYHVQEFGGECSRQEIERGKRGATASKANVVIGAGGGKVLDSARAIASELELPIVNCPTVASSDAPCSALSVVYTPDGKFEEYIFYKKNPDLVLVDTSVIAKASPRLLIAGMGDALATWFEARTVVQARKRNQVGGATTESATVLAKLCYETLLNDGVSALHSVRNQVVTPALERIVEANTLLSGLGFESGGLALAHSIHNGLTVIPETHAYYHGEKVAFGLIVQLVAEGQPTEEIEEVMAFCASVGLPLTLSDIGIDDTSPDVIKAISDRATATAETAHNEPFVVTASLVGDAIVAANSLGKAWTGKDTSGEFVFASS